MRSSQRRIAFPTFRPTSKSLSWIFLCTETATSKILRVLLDYMEEKRIRPIMILASIVNWHQAYLVPKYSDNH
jgi:hypothetical protein